MPDVVELPRIDSSSASTELLRARGSERRVSPEPRRFAKGTSPVGARRARPSQAFADEATVMELGLADRTATDVAIDPDHTTPNLPLADRTQPGVALPPLRGRVAR